MRLLVTTGAGFIGSAFVRLVNLDKLTYAANLENLTTIESDPRYRFAQGDISDTKLVVSLIEEEKPDAIVHFAAESHVDRSILGPAAFVETNIRGTFSLLEAARDTKLPRFLHASTDEVYGSIDEPHDADEEYPLKTASPYSASKAGSDLLALSYFTTFKTGVTVTRASNNYGPYQFPEKLIPLMISNALEGKSLPIYNVGGSRALPNRTVVEMILDAVGQPHSLMTAVADRPGHDRRYAITTAKLEKATGWQALMPFEQGLAETINWYKANAAWITRVRSGEYQSYYEKNYQGR